MSGLIEDLFNQAIKAEYFIYVSDKLELSETEPDKFIYVHKTAIPTLLITLINDKFSKADQSESSLLRIIADIIDNENALCREFYIDKMINELAALRINSLRTSMVKPVVESQSQVIDVWNDNLSASFMVDMTSMILDELISCGDIKYNFGNFVSLDDLYEQVCKKCRDHGVVIPQRDVLAKLMETRHNSTKSSYSINNKLVGGFTII